MSACAKVICRPSHHHHLHPPSLIRSIRNMFKHSVVRSINFILFLLDTANGGGARPVGIREQKHPIL